MTSPTEAGIWVAIGWITGVATLSLAQSIKEWRQVRHSRDAFKRAARQFGERERR